MQANDKPTRGRSPRPLHKAILSLAVAAVIGASIPFSAMYVRAVQTPPAVISSPPTASSGKSAVKIVTTASGRRVTVPANAAGQSGAGSVVAPVSTRASD